MKREKSCHIKHVPVEKSPALQQSDDFELFVSENVAFFFLSIKTKVGNRLISLELGGYSCAGKRVHIIKEKPLCCRSSAHWSSAAVIEQPPPSFICM